MCNPQAGNGRVQRRWPEIERLLLTSGITIESALTSSPGEATKMVVRAIERGFRYILGIGGDGTNNEIINGILQQRQVPSIEITYALLPIGTCNDWARTHGLPHRLKPFLKMLLDDHCIHQDVGWVSCEQEGKEVRRFFANVAGLAYDAHVVRETARTNSHLPGKLRYIHMALKSFVNFRPERARVLYDDQQIEEYFYLINVGICRYSGGGMQLVPHARFDDGQLAVTLAAELGPRDIILNLPSIYRGTLANHPRILTFHTKDIRIDAADDKPVYVEIDGEFIGHTPVEIGVVKKALRLRIPRS
ncbi:MAG: diacylglycerol kinase family protein [Bacteroidota bacterium]